jgi:DNA-binding transcriptional ArsR family regulator
VSSTAAARRPVAGARRRQLYDTSEHTVQQIADIFGVPRTTVYGHLEPERHRQPTGRAHHRERQRLVTVNIATVERVGRWLVPVVFITIGTVILIESGVTARLL